MWTVGGSGSVLWSEAWDRAVQSLSLNCSGYFQKEDSFLRCQGPGFLRPLWLQWHRGGNASRWVSVPCSHRWFLWLLTFLYCFPAGSHLVPHLGPCVPRGLSQENLAKPTFRTLENKLGCICFLFYELFFAKPGADILDYVCWGSPAWLRSFILIVPHKDPDMGVRT